MRALVARAGGGLEIDEVPRPEPGPGEVRVRVGACGICGSDLHLQGLGLYMPGLVPGHEFAGVVDEVGPEVTGFSAGDPVAVEPFRSCGVCRECREGRDPCCSQARLLGVHVPGGLAEFALAPARRLYRTPADLPPALAALAEPTAVAVHGLARLPEIPERLLVLGAGSIGLLTLLAARAAGVAEVWVTARHPHQAAIAQALGAARVLDEAESGAEALAALPPFDAAVETVGGRAETLADAAAAVRPGGVVSVVGFFTGRVGFDALPLMMKELTLAWSYCYHRGGENADFHRAIALLDAEREAAARIASHALPLADAPAAYALAADKKAGVVKVSVLP